jgi:HK97 family phage major capsid protein
VPGGGSDSGEWGSELVTADNRYTGDFIEYLYAMTVFDQLPLREIPANVTVKGTDGAATANWVGQSKGIPVTSGSASTVSLSPLKVAALAVVSNELLADSTPAAEMWIRDLLAEAMSQRVDQTFLSASAASAGVSPAGILNGISAKTSAGTSADNIRTDIEVLMGDFIAARHVGGLTFVTSRGLALAIQLMRNSLGLPEFNGVALSGGTLEGMRLVTGDNVGSGDFILLDPREIWKIGDTGVQVSISREATIEQDTAPQGATDTPVAASANMTNMFQEDSTAIRLIRRINYQKRRTSAVAFVGDAGYGGVAS